MPTMEIPEVNCEPIPGYRLLESLGKGSFGDVWKCEAPGGLKKAIKFIRGISIPAGPGTARPDQESHALQQIQAIRHPFMLSIERVEFIDNDLVIVMELAERSLADLFATYRKCGRPGIPRNDLLGYLREAAEVLDLMNERHGLQHLDVKPRNLFVVGRHVKVADYGLVACVATLHGVAPQTVQLESATSLYTAPESFLGNISPFSDQYGLAVVYCEMLTGELPFAGKNSRQQATQQLQTPNLDLLHESERGPVSRALRQDPTQRFACCRDFVNALSGGSTTNNGTRFRPAAAAVPSPKPNAGPRLPRAAAFTEVAPRILQRAWVASQPAETARNARTMRPLANVLGEPVSQAVGQLVETVQGDRQIHTYKKIRYLLKPGVSIEHRCFAWLTPSMVKVQLQESCDKLGAKLVEADGNTYSFHVPIKGSLMERLRGLWPRLAVKIRCLFPPNPMLTLADIAIEIGLIDCQRRQREALLAEAGPALLDNIRTLLQAHPERRFAERIGFDQEVIVFPVKEGQQVGDPIVGQGRDISLHGMGVFMPTRPTTPHVSIQLTWSSRTTPMTVLAQVKNSRPCADGRHLVGLFFLQILQP